MKIGKWIKEGRQKPGTGKPETMTEDKPEEMTVEAKEKKEMEEIKTLGECILESLKKGYEIEFSYDYSWGGYLRLLVSYGNYHVRRAITKCELEAALLSTDDIIIEYIERAIREIEAVKEHLEMSEGG